MLANKIVLLTYLKLHFIFNSLDHMRKGDSHTPSNVKTVVLCVYGAFLYGVSLSSGI